MTGQNTQVHKECEVHSEEIVKMNAREGGGGGGGGGRDGSRGGGGSLCTLFLSATLLLSAL